MGYRMSMASQAAPSEQAILSVSGGRQDDLATAMGWRNPKREEPCLIRKRSSTPARFVKSFGARAMRWPIIFEVHREALSLLMLIGTAITMNSMIA